MSVIVPARNEKGETCEAACDILWAFEAEVHGADVIVGYPFLSLFHFAVQCDDNCLSFVTSACDTRIDHPGDLWTTRRPQASDALASIPDERAHHRSRIKLISPGTCPPLSPVNPVFHCAPEGHPGLSLDHDTSSSGDLPHSTLLSNLDSTPTLTSQNLPMGVS